ncbi:MAG: mechanosensitive ion channel [Proteobacteria bacterium]|nr:mechanosensitive ion channel [Pseudomonadota bacterium]
MSRAITRSLLALAAVLAFCAGATAQDEGDGEPASVIATQADAGSDAAIARRLDAILGEIKGLEAVEVAVADGVVRLSGRVLSPDLAGSAAAIARRIEGVVVVENRIEGETAIVPRLQPVMERLIKRLNDFVRFLPLLALGLLVLAVFWVAGGVVMRRERLFERLSPNPFIADLWRQVVFLGFVLTGGLIAADIMGATALIGSLLGAAGLVGLAIGFAVRDTIENYIATILLSLRQPFAAMDHVAIEGNEGTVARLSSRATILITAEGNHVRIPNATVFKAVIVNYTRNPERRLEFKVGIDPGCDLARALAVA